MSTRSIFPNLNEVQHVAVIGTGLIGAGWVAQFLLYGLKTSVWDPAPDFEDRLMGQLQDVFSRLHVDQDHQARCLNALNFAENLEAAAASAQFIQENGPENLQVKRGILEELARAVPPDVVIASSASGLPMSELQQGCLHPERLVIGHPFNPVYMIPLVEIVAGSLTGAETVTWVEGFYRSLGKAPVVCDRENVGFIANRLQEALFREALHMVKAGDATVGQIDDVVRYGLGVRWAFMGPFLSYHFAGGREGLSGFFERFGETISEPYSRLQAPELSQELIDSVLDQGELAFGGQSIEDAEQWRDDCLSQILALSNREGGMYRVQRQQPGEQVCCTKPPSDGISDNGC